MVEKMENDKSDQQKKLVHRYWGFVRTYRYGIVFIRVLGIMSFAVPLALRMMVKMLIDEILPGNDSFWSLKSLILVMGGIFVVSIMADFIRDCRTVRLARH